MELNLGNIKVSATSAIIACIAPVFLILLSFYLLSPDFFMRCDLTRLFIIAIGLTIPIVIVSGVAVGAMSDAIGSKEKKREEVDEWYGSGALASVNISMALAISYFSLLTMRGVMFWAITLGIVELIIFASIAYSRKQKANPPPK